MDNINVILYKGLKNYFSTLFNYGEMNASDTNKLLVLKYIKDLLSSGRVFTYKQTNIIQAVVRCLAGTSCLLEVPKAIIKNSYTPSAPAQKEESYIDAIKLLQEEYETLSNEMKTKQTKLIAGDNITIQNNVISATGSSPFTVNLSPLGADRFSPDKTWAEVQNAYTDGNDIKFNLSGQEFIVTMFIVNGGLAASTVVLDGSEPVAYTLSWLSTDNYVLVANAGISLQRKLTFDDVPTQSSDNPVKSGGVYDAFSTYCPIIEDTRSSAVAAITGVAPFDTLVDGQRIMLKLNYVSANGTTLTLTLSNTTTTSPIPVYAHTSNSISQIALNHLIKGVYELIYIAADGRWYVIGKDRDTTYPLINNGMIEAGINTTACSINAPTLRANFYLKKEVDNLCPIIEDTRSSAVATITGVAPFASLVDGQRIVLRLAYNTVGNSALNLTLSNDTTTGAKAIKIASNRQTEINVGTQFYRADDYAEMVYDGGRDVWKVVGQLDTNNTYAAMTQAEIDAGTGTTVRSITPKMLCDNFDKVTTLVEVTATGDVTQALDSGKFYRFGEVDSLTLTFTAPSAGLGMWGGKFTASTNWSALGIPATIDEAAGNDSIAGGKTYEFNMVDNVIVIKEV